MALESPLFQSSMELLGHSISHFVSQKELDRKLLILHLANSVELILKDMLLDIEKSIYKNPKETVTVTGSIQMLTDEGVSIPFLNKIELLIDERNALQHRFGSPNELTAIFYMNIAEEFFKEVLKTHYRLDYDETLGQFADESDLLALRMRKPSNDSELENLKKLSSIHPLGALLSAFSYLEGKIAEFSKNTGLESELRMRPPWAFMSHRFLERYGVELSPELAESMNEIRKIRNMAAHGRKDPTKAEVKKSIETIEKYEKVLEGIDLEKVKRAIEVEREERELRRREGRSQQGDGDND